jgi:hypothetical protein
MAAEQGDRRGDRQAGLVGAGAWVDAARWLAWWEAEHWERTSWQVQATAAWQLAKVGRFLQRDADDGR